jgi:hypothetical protein
MFQNAIGQLLGNAQGIGWLLVNSQMVLESHWEVSK